MIAPHNCTQNSQGKTNGAEYQDKKYGKGNRVWTEDKEGKQKHCTVCGQKK